jgi:hypothetical protein
LALDHVGFLLGLALAAAGLGAFAFERRDLTA